MAKDSNRVGLFITIPLYLIFMVGCGLYVWLKNNRQASRTDSAGPDALTQHYLGGRDFGPIITVMTCFASLFSGYTVVGVPNEASRVGFVAFRWIALAQMTVFSCMLTAPRLRRLSLARSYYSPCDFIADRFGSNILRYSIFALMLVPSWMYLAGQVDALASVFNEMLFELEKLNPGGILIISAIILSYEWLGGLQSVALTDSAQGMIMVLGFFALLIMTCVHFGGVGRVGSKPTPQTCACSPRATVRMPPAGSGSDPTRDRLSRSATSSASGRVSRRPVATRLRHVQR